MTGIEIAANAFNTGSIVLAGRNSLHTWWTGIVGCVLFVIVFSEARLYADASLQLFFIVTCALGWRAWQKRERGAADEQALQIRRANARILALGTVAAIAVTMLYATLLRHYTHAAAPLPDSAVLAFSVLAQLLLMRRYVESWWGWLLVNTLSVPLYYSRGLTLTAILYAVYWLNALVALRRWRREAT